MFKRSTRAIVAGRRNRPNTQIVDTDNGGQTIPDPEDSTEIPENPKENEFARDNLKQTMRAFLWSPVGVLILAIVGILLAIALIVMDPRGTANQNGTLSPEVDEGKVVVAVASDAALSGQVYQGDVVKLYAADGSPIPELQYVQVYKPSTDGGLLLLVDDLQAAALVSQEINPMVVLVVHNDSARAADMLALQARINDPEISLALQETASLAPEETLELNYKLSIDPAEAVQPQLEWSTSDPAVVTVENGTVTAHGVGQAIVWAACGDVKASCAVAVEVPLEGIVLDPAECSLAVAETVQLSATAKPGDSTYFVVDWSVADPAIATISNNGTITGISPGSTSVTASCGNIKAECMITVGVHAEMVKLDKPALYLVVGQTDSLSASIYPSTDVIDVGTFESSDPAVVTVSEDGTVTAVGAGTATITFRCGEATDICYITVENSEY